MAPFVVTAIILVVGIVVFGIYLYGHNLVPGIAPANQAAANVAPRNPYPADVQQNFMNSCVVSGGTQPLCGCVLTAIEDRYTLQEYSRIETQMAATRQFPDDVLNIVADCRVQIR